MNWIKRIVQNSIVWLIIIFAVSVISKICLLDTVWYKIWGDELYYNDMARSLYQSGTLKFANMYGPNTAYFYPMVLSLLFPFYNAENFIFASRILGIVTMSSTIIPVYLLTKEMNLSQKKSLFICALTVMVPDMLQTLFTVSEVVAYPIFMWTLYFYIKQIKKEKVSVYTLFLALCMYVAYMVRAQNLVFFVAFVVYSLVYLFLSIKRKEKTKANLELGRLIVVAVIFIALYAIIPKVLIYFGVIQMQTTTTELGISRVLDGIKNNLLYSFMNWSYGCLWYLFYILLSFGVFTITIPIAHKYEDEIDSRFKCFLNILLLGFIAVVVVMIAGNEDAISHEFKRVHLRYVFYFFVPYILLLYKVDVKKIKNNIVSLLLYVLFIAFILTNGIASGLATSFGVEDFSISIIKELRSFLKTYPFVEGHLHILILLACASIAFIIKSIGWGKFINYAFPAALVLGCMVNQSVAINSLQDVTTRGNAGFLERNLPIANVLNSYEQGEVVLLASSLSSDNEIQSLQLLLEKSVDKLSLAEFDLEIEKGNGIVDFSEFERTPFVYAKETGHILENAKCVGVRRMWIDGKYNIANEIIYQSNYFIIYALNDGKMTVSKVTEGENPKEDSKRETKKNTYLEADYEPEISFPSEPMEMLSTEKINYVKAVHYFSDAWPLNFWSSEIENLSEELTQIKNDGFNTIVLVLPWKEFQASVSPIKYNQYPFEKLERIMQEAQKQDIFVMVRIGYTWDFYCDDSEDVLGERYFNILHDTSTKEAWKEYAAAIYTTVNKYNNFLGGIICWEDFWNNVYIAKAADSTNNVALARQFGYQDYLKENYSLEEVSGIYGEQFDSFDSLYIPSADHVAFALFYEFYDSFLNSLLYDTQVVFPNLSMEVRVDADLVNTESGYQYYGHEATYECVGSDFTTIVYGIPMGFENKGERVSAEEAIRMTTSILANVNQVIDEKAIFVDQFLFFDNTPAFSYNAQVKEEELELYLDMAAEVLTNQTWGYGIWTYRDYYSNMLYNSEFALGTSGWTLSGNGEIKVVEESNMLLLKEDASVSQNIVETRNHFGTDVIYVQFDVQLPSEVSSVNVRVTLGKDVQTVAITKNGTYGCVFEQPDYSSFSIQVDDEILLDNFFVYSHEQDGRLYSSEDEEEECLNAIKELNNQITELLVYKEQNKPFYSLIDNLDFAKVTGLVESKDYLQNKNFGSYYDRLNGEEAIYITPGVSVEYEIALDEIGRFLKFSYEYYEAAKEWGSDGARIDISINGEHIDSVLISPQENRLEYQLDLSKYAGATITLKIECHQNGDAIGDWILLYLPMCK